MCNPNGIECYEVGALTSEASCLKECEGMHSVVQINANNRTLPLNGRLSNKKLQTFFQEYLQFKRGYETEFDNFYEDILTRKGPVYSEKGWPFLNEQAALTPKLFDSWGSPSRYEVEQRLEIIEIYFEAPTLEKITRDARTNFVTKVSMIGGMLGLFAGFSVISGIEIVYFVIRLFLQICKKRDHLRDG